MRPAAPLRAREDAVIARALGILKDRIDAGGERYQANHPGAVETYVRMRMGELEREVFAVVFLDAACRAFAIEELFQGTLTQTLVHPREIARAALRHNAASVVLVHNHPSGVAEFSAADKQLTEDIREALRTLGVGVADHLLVAGRSVASYETNMALQYAAARAEWRARAAAAARARRAARKGQALGCNP